MTEVIVIGAGLVGSALTYRLAQGDARVTCLEANHPGSGTSGASFAWLNANSKTPRAYYDLNVAGMEEHSRLRGELGAAPWLHDGGNLEWAEDEAGRARLQAKTERLRSWGYAVESLTPGQVQAGLESDLRLDQHLVGDVFYYPDERWLDALPLIHTLQEGAARHGARLRTNSRVTGVVAESGRVQGVILESGERIGADWVISCSGRVSDQVAAFVGFALPLANTAGLLAITAPAPVCVSRIIHAPGLNLRPDGAGRLLLHAESVDGTVDEATEPGTSLPGCTELLRRARKLFPLLVGTRIESARIGIRPIPAGGLSAVGPVPGMDGAYIVATHSGATLCLALARLVAQEICFGQPAEALAAFRPARFRTPREPD